MNKVSDILEAWIRVEQLSEGDISRNHKKYRQFLNQSYIEELRDFVNTHTKGLSPQKAKYAGLVIYFGIFPFQQILDTLRQKYNLVSTAEELTTSDKFTFALYFDNQLNFIPGQFFYTISGHIRQTGSLVDDFYRVEEDLADFIEKRIQDIGFDAFFTQLLKQYNFSASDCRYSFVENVEASDRQMHSSFIDDLELAKQLKTSNLERYLQGFSGEIINLDSRNSSNAHQFLEILAPKNYPLGRFPSNTRYPLSMMQQVAVHLALDTKNDIQSVNGPPGTGKTTLLRDIFADLIVQQADVICRLDNTVLKGSMPYSDEGYTVAPLLRDVADKGIVVASSNNGAVQNIVKELPQYSSVDKSSFLTDLIAADYFKDIANDSENKELNWGMFSVEGGKFDNRQQLISILNKMFEELNSEDFIQNEAVYEEFRKSYQRLEQKRQQVQVFADQIAVLPKLRAEVDRLEKEMQDQNASYLDKVKIIHDESTAFSVKKERVISQLEGALLVRQRLLQEQQTLQQMIELLKLRKPVWFWLKKLIVPDKVSGYLTELKEISDKLHKSNLDLSNEDNNVLSLQQEQDRLEKQLYSLDDQRTQSEKVYQKKFEAISKQLEKYRLEIARLEDKIESSNIKIPDFSLPHEQLQKSNFWFDDDYRYEQSQLFIKALAVRKQFLYENKKHFQKAIWIWSDQGKYLSRENGKELIQSAWDWVNFAIPVISTTFASFGRMFKHLSTNSIGHLFIDEAGQALPQSSVGAIFRSKRIFVVGDPSQIEPVLSLDSNVLGVIASHHRVTERYLSPKVSTQSLVDSASQYGFLKSDGSWIGLPLWVHRRSNYPMFTISNVISYDGLMVQGKDDSEGAGDWIDVAGHANDKYVVEQADVLKKLLLERQRVSPDIFNEIYVITPFKNVARQLEKELNTIHFTKYVKGKVTNIGTVHTFQGKEARIVYFVLGADTRSRGAASWFASQSNIMNVAVTRAKEEFYIIGDKALYRSLKSPVIEQTITILDEYNQKE